MKEKFRKAFAAKVAILLNWKQQYSLRYPYDPWASPEDCEEDENEMSQINQYSGQLIIDVLLWIIAQTKYKDTFTQEDADKISEEVQYAEVQYAAAKVLRTLVANAKEDWFADWMLVNIADYWEKSFKWRDFYRRLNRE